MYLYCIIIKESPISRLNDVLSLNVYIYGLVSDLEKESFLIHKESNLD